jgi:hypothetical protein
MGYITTRSLGLLSLTLATMAVLADPALARPTKVALTIDGDNSGLRKAVVAALDDTDLEVVSAKKMAKAFEHLGIEDVTSASEADKLASELHVEAVVKGAFDQDAKRLKFTIYTNGKTGGSFFIKVDGARSSKFKKAVRAKMLAKIGPADDDEAKAENQDKADDKAKPDAKAAKAKKKGDPADAEEVADAGKKKHKTKKQADDVESDATADASDAKPSRKAKHDDEATDASDAKPSRKGKHDDEADDSDAKPSRKAKHDENDVGPHFKKHVAAADDEDDDAAVGVHRSVAMHDDGARAQPMVRVDVGASFTARSLHYVLTHQFDGAPPSERNRPVAGGRVAAEIYPLAINRHISLGAAGDYDQATGLTINAPPNSAQPSASPVGFKVSQRSYSVGGRIRYAFTETPTSPTVTLGVDYGGRSFTVDRSNLMAATSLDLPDVSYKMVEPGLSVRVPIGKWVALMAGGQVLLVRSAGAIAQSADYGGAHVTGGSGEAGIDIALGHRLLLRMIGEFTQVGLTFYGNGNLSTNRDGDPTTVDVHGAVDRYYGGAATLAFTY